MDKLKKVLDGELNTLLMQMPEKGGTTINSMLQRVSFIADNQELFMNKLNMLGNMFSKENKLTEKEKKDLVNLLDSYFLKFSYSFS